MSRAPSFRARFEAMVATRALCGADRYEHGVGIGWMRHPAYVPAWTRPPDLAGLLARLVAEAEEA